MILDGDPLSENGELFRIGHGATWKGQGRVEALNHISKSSEANHGRGVHAAINRLLLSPGWQCKYLPVVATLAWPSVLCTRLIGAPRSSA